METKFTWSRLYWLCSSSFKIKVIQYLPYRPKSNTVFAFHTNMKCLPFVPVSAWRIPSWMLPQEYATINCIALFSRLLKNVLVPSSHYWTCLPFEMLKWHQTLFIGKELVHFLLVNGKYCCKVFITHIFEAK